MNTPEYKVCRKCVMDQTASEFQETETGCNFCDNALLALQEVEWSNTVDMFPEISGKEYDCLIGLSGGVDSSFALHCAVELGYRPLCFSVDTGYNKPEADENIMKLVEGLKVPFYRYTIDLERFKELQGAFLRAGVKNIEIPTDHILMAVSYEIASKYNIKTIISGGNVATESIMPVSWGDNARDLTYIKDLFKRMTGKRLKGLPVCSVWKWNWYRWIRKIKIVYLLDYLNYNRSEAEALLTEKYGFVSTGEKHEENFYTWWFQNYYLFEKFGIDKRKAHYSSMIVSGQMTREEAMEKLSTQPVYPSFGIEKKVLKYKEQIGFKTDPWYNRISKLVRFFNAHFE